MFLCILLQLKSNKYRLAMGCVPVFLCFLLQLKSNKYGQAKGCVPVFAATPKQQVRVCYGVCSYVPLNFVAIELNQYGLVYLYAHVPCTFKGVPTYTTPLVFPCSYVPLIMCSELNRPSHFCLFSSDHP